MKVAVMPPYFFPYIGYFQLLNAVDTYVMYDNLEFTKGKYFNRNTVVLNGKKEFFTVNLEKSSDFAMVSDKRISAEYRRKNCSKTLARIEQSYRKAPFFKEIMPLLREAFEHSSDELFAFNMNSITMMMDLLDIDTKIVVSSTIDIDHTLKNKDRLFEICKAMHTVEYWNPEGGAELYNHKEFEERGMQLRLLYAHQTEYNQIHSEEFQPYLSIIDVLMHNSVPEIKEMLTNYSINL